MEILIILFIILAIRFSFVIASSLKIKNKKILYIENFVVYNKMVYWILEGKLYRAYDREADKETPFVGQEVDQLNSGLLPSEIIGIIKKLEKA
jgi:hypothetical protein